MDGQPINYRLIILHKFSHRSESSDTHIMLPSRGQVSKLRKEEPPEQLAMKVKRV